MARQFDIRTRGFKNYLKKVLLLIVPLVAMAPLAANAFPLFCSDMASAPDGVLTGCQFSGIPSTPQEAPSRTVAAVGDASDSIDQLLSMTPKNRHLFQVGRDAIADHQDSKKENGYTPGATQKRTVADVVADIKPPVADSEIIRRDAQWYYMNIDQDGTYLFFGNMLDKDELASRTDEDDYLPEGIGIGKKWHF